MNKYLLEYCTYIKNFKPEQNIVIIDDGFKIVHINNHEFFQRYSDSFALNTDIFECLRELPCFNTKQHIYDNLIKTKRVQGYFVAQDINGNHEYLVDSIHLLPILDPDKNLVGIELEVIDMQGLPLITLSGDNDIQNADVINLTEREREIIILKAMGKTNLEISYILGSIHKKEISQHTIANIIKQQIYPKLNVENKQSLIKAAHALGLDQIIPKSLITESQLILFPSFNL
jgi:DNA-binding CsgD family transcriptional regulator